MAVAPFAGAWIEIPIPTGQQLILRSLPSRERGLKYPIRSNNVGVVIVAPFAGAWIEMAANVYQPEAKPVAPFAGAWIEISAWRSLAAMSSRVAPFAGAWIEMPLLLRHRQHTRSLPSRERGLKSQNAKAQPLKAAVAPFAGAWIEIVTLLTGYNFKIVAPFAGAWIEIVRLSLRFARYRVAPFAGAWIEII